jgi:hypothetical protein
VSGTIEESAGLSRRTTRGSHPGRSSYIDFKKRELIREPLFQPYKIIFSFQTIKVAVYLIIITCLE